MRALVTGGAGFIGSTLVDRLLAEGHAVDVVDDLSTGSLANLADARASADHELTFHQLDIRSPEVVDLIAGVRPDVVFHLAAQADVRVSVADPVFDADVNLLGTLRVLEGARRGRTPTGGVRGERGDPLRRARRIRAPAQGVAAPATRSRPTACRRRRRIDYLVAYRELHSLEFAALALANVYGPRQDPHGEAGVVAIFAERLLRGRAVTIFGDGEQTRDFVYVDDVVDAFVRAPPGRRPGVQHRHRRETSVNELLREMAAQAGVDAGRPTSRSAPGELLRNCLDATRAGIHLGWKSVDHARCRDRRPCSGSCGADWRSPARSELPPRGAAGRTAAANWQTLWVDPGAPNVGGRPSPEAPPVPPLSHESASMPPSAAFLRRSRRALGHRGRPRPQSITEPFPIQAMTLPDALAGRDVCGKAPTGSGKTLAFGIGAVARLSGQAARPEHPRVLVLTPTRELAAQVASELAAAGRRRAACGWTPSTVASATAPSSRRCPAGVDIAVACPGSSG